MLISIRKKLEHLYWSLEKVIIPNLKHSQCEYERVLRNHITKGAIWLDLGCGHKMLPKWMESFEKELIQQSERIFGIDYDFNSLLINKSIKLKVRGGLVSLPFKNNTFDVISSNMVLEHIQNPSIVFAEVYRILKPNGFFIFHTPNIYGYSTIASHLIPSLLHKKIIYWIDNRSEDDTFNTYYLINKPDAIRKTATGAGLKIKELKLVSSSARLIIFPALVIFELLYIKALQWEPLKNLRTNIIAVLEKPN